MQEDTPPTGQQHSHHTSSDTKTGQGAPEAGTAHDGAGTSDRATTDQSSAPEHQETQHGSRHHTNSGDGRDELDHAALGHGATHHMQSRATGPQKFVVGLASVLALVIALIFCATYANLSISAPQVESVVMPPGMIMTYDSPAEAMRDMAAVDPRAVSYAAPADIKGDQPLSPHIENGVKVFDLETSVIKWNILPQEQVMAYAFNHQVPGPRIRITEGDRVRINVTNKLPESTTVHWHGLILPNAMDGPAEITQEPIAPGQTYTYEFTSQQAGTFFYHTHDHADRQQALGLYGALIIDPQDTSNQPAYDLEYTIQLQEWLEREGYTYPAMLMEGGLPNYFTINGKAYPSTDTIPMRVGQKLLVRFIGSNNNFVHPMHIHGGPFEVVARDGESVPPGARFLADTVNVGPGQRYDVTWEAREPGKWLIHCHIPHHTTNNNVEEQGGGGLTLIINVTP
jgi:manganese oxidase